MARLERKVVVISGAASGIGAACVHRCQAEGATVVMLDQTDPGPRAAGSAPGGVFISVDVAAREPVEQAMSRIAREHGRIDGLVSCAGIAYRATVAAHDEGQWDELMRVNVRGAFLCSKYAIPHMPRGASIVHMASGVGLVGVRNRAGYTASKGALIALTRNMALDFAPRGIRVNCVCPGFTRTPLISRLLSDPEREARLTELHPLGRLGEPVDVANAVVFLLSEEASWITGAALPVDGGFAAGHFQDV